MKEAEWFVLTYCGLGVLAIVYIVWQHHMDVAKRDGLPFPFSKLKRKLTSFLSRSI